MLGINPSLTELLSNVQKKQQYQILLTNKKTQQNCEYKCLKTNQLKKHSSMRILTQKPFSGSQWKKLVFYYTLYYYRKQKKNKNKKQNKKQKKISLHKKKCHNYVTFSIILCYVIYLKCKNTLLLKNKNKNKLLSSQTKH